MPTTIAVKDASGSNVTVNTLDAVVAILGQVSASPTSNTLLDRLKTIATSLAAIEAAVDGSEVQVDIVSGTVTADLGATDNAVLDAIAAAAAAIQAAVEATLTIGGTVDLGATDNAVLDAIAAALSGTLGVAGTVDLGATDNAVLDAIASAAAAIQTAVEVMDDWDETNRAAVNVIPSQVGISAGAGAVAPNTPRVTLASDDPGVAKLNTIDQDTSAIAQAVEGDYETVAASQTAQALGATGAAGDFISHVLLIPATTSPGAVALLDNATSITIFTGGTDSVSNLVPFSIPLNMISASGAWSITTGANVSVIAVGSFT